jgi:hypothetical protein
LAVKIIERKKIRHEKLSAQKNTGLRIFEPENFPALMSDMMMNKSGYSGVICLPDLGNFPA